MIKLQRKKVTSNVMYFACTSLVYYVYFVYPLNLSVMMITLEGTVALTLPLEQFQLNKPTRNPPASVRIFALLMDFY